jgi:osmotically inducible protein OsmC
MERRATTVWEGNLRDGSGRVSFASGALPEVPVTFRARTEAANEGTSPEELIAAAHATCYAMVLANMLNSEGSPAERLTVEATCELDRIEGALKITKMRLDVRARVAGFDQPRFDELARTGEQRCPVSNALRNNVEITVSATLES